MNAIVVQAGAVATIADVTIDAMLGAGIVVSGGTVSIGPGVASTSNGLQASTLAGYASPGVRVTGTGTAVFAGSVSDPTMFAGNSAEGILVDQSG